MLSGQLWPVHPHPYQGECLSSWLVRIAHANGMKVQTFCGEAFGREFQVWNRDIERLRPEWLLETLSKKTATRYYDVRQTTFFPFEGRLFHHYRSAGVLRWALPLVMYHRKRKGHGMQYCPLCLKEDKDPYYRTAWRIAMYTFCPFHDVLMNDRCSFCGADVAFHRIELGKPEQIDVESIAQCWNCERLLSDTPAIPIDCWHATSFKMWRRILKAIARSFVNSGPVNYDRLLLLHQICKILSSPTQNKKILKYICHKTGMPTQEITRRNYFEQLDHQQRHYILQLAWWLVGNTDKKIKTALAERALRVNYLYRDSDEACLLRWRQ